jgi:hypothetical protein
LQLEAGQRRVRCRHRDAYSYCDRNRHPDQHGNRPSDGDSGLPDGYADGDQNIRTGTDDSADLHGGCNVDGDGNEHRCCDLDRYGHGDSENDEDAASYPHRDGNGNGIADGNLVRNGNGYSDLVRCSGYGHADFDSGHGSGGRSRASARMCCAGIGQ